VIEEFLGDQGLGCLTVLPRGCLVLLLLSGGALGLLAVVAMGGSFMACFGGLLVVAAIDRGLGSVTPVAVVGHRWERTVDVDELREERDDDWCDDIPDEARVIEVEERFHHREKRIGPDRDIYEDWCTYTVLEWKRVDEKVARGEGLSPAPTWPAVPDDGCAREGCRRAGDRDEQLEVLFEARSGHSGDPYSCDMDGYTEWAGWHEGDQGKLLIGGMLGAVYCGDLERTSPDHPPAQAPEEDAPRTRPDRGDRGDRGERGERDDGGRDRGDKGRRDRGGRGGKGGKGGKSGKGKTRR